MSLEQFLQEAIQGEVASYTLYTRTANMVRTQHVQDALLELAQEELGHKAKLEQMLASAAELRWATTEIQQANIHDYQVADHLVVQPLGPDSTFQDVCIFASHKEQQSHDLYLFMAEQTEGPTREVLEAMARDELRHKDLVERWYEEVVYQDF